MARNFFKKETSKYYTSWDLNCRKFVPHNKSRNELERKFKRKVRRENKISLKKYLQEDYFYDT